jgi:hypothetical protein
VPEIETNKHNDTQQCHGDQHQDGDDNIGCLKERRRDNRAKKLKTTPPNISKSSTGSFRKKKIRE